MTPANRSLPAHVPLVAASRGGQLESIHYGSAVLLGPDGRIAMSLGDAGARFYPRSALKPLFAVAMLRAGLELDDEQIALAAASHSGSGRHQQVALSTLHQAGLQEEDLGNSRDLPYGPAERQDWLASGGTATRLAQNCSGKHAALLALCRLKGWPTAGYLGEDHPLADLLAQTVQELTGERITTVSTDGCGTQVYPLTLAALARGFARLASAAPGTAEHRVASAMRRHPDLVAGHGRDVTELMLRLPGAVAKDGFEGIQAVGLPDGWAVAVKIADGTDRARMPITIKLLTAHLGAAAPAALQELASSPALGGGQPVGELAAL
ncbi:asparaginase [Glutamicibacter sp. MNS18]|uniref:asparaginase n=1 Tax=Glutamicibacter sp. MNS18 TaxID=2989817 RepID=UPI0022362958|nr:asparaginase [Glutamicibacter sp. MNS18]MCW4465547.1 asparaginase [Glutamicibacter sp. MNS18]